MNKKEILTLITITLLFFLLRLPGLDNSYHQDEYKWPRIVLSDNGYIPHPPVGETIYKNLGKLVGPDNFRFIPFIFSTINFFLLFLFVKRIGDIRTALWSIFLYSISFYSVLASLMVDTDGAIMPSFLLLMLIGYFELRKKDFVIRDNYKWLALLLFGLVGGFFVKTSFIIPIGAIIFDFLIQKNVFENKKRVINYASLIGLGFVGLALLLFFAKVIFPSFDLSASFKYWEHFIKFGGRGWGQVFIQFAKALMYCSPLLLAPIFFVNRNIFHKLRPLFFFIFFGLIFYLILFDFSTGALDRYFQFLIIPLSIIISFIFKNTFNSDQDNISKVDYISVSLIALGIFGIQFTNHFIYPLYPKSAWLEKILYFKWNFLFPFTGGSGPTGFYISFLFIALIFGTSFVFAISRFKIKESSKRAVFCILTLGILYNAVFIEEYLSGKINGSPYPLIEKVVEVIKENKNIKNVVVYNDIGGYEVQNTGKYSRRMYAVPAFEDTYKKFFDGWQGHIVYIDIPKIGKDTFYANYMSKCKIIYSQNHNYINSFILECKK